MSYAMFLCLYYSHAVDCIWFCCLLLTYSLEKLIQIVAAHICYLVAEANFEQYSDTARLCLVGADHLKFPRTYASPEAIQVLLTSSYCAFSSHTKKM